MHGSGRAAGSAAGGCSEEEETVGIRSTLQDHAGGGPGSGIQGRAILPGGLAGSRHHTVPDGGPNAGGPPRLAELSQRTGERWGKPKPPAVAPRGPPPLSRCGDRAEISPHRAPILSAGTPVGSSSTRGGSPAERLARSDCGASGRPGPPATSALVKLGRGVRRVGWRRRPPLEIFRRLWGLTTRAAGPESVRFIVQEEGHSWGGWTGSWTGNWCWQRWNSPPRRPRSPFPPLAGALVGARGHRKTRRVNVNVNLAR